jgi:hypothetical protein
MKDVSLRYHARFTVSKELVMALLSPNDRNLLNVIAHFEREISGKPLTLPQLTRIAEAVKRSILDELHSMKTVS